ncbi:MAG: biopolymer transporter ExbD [Bacteroidales bacterium]|jgi:biopolymer transport protein ExbD|nr:biopolymer transporter ExbD [Bacteroidales bacterium]MBO7546043.1 biopolymer transporter ExbD [Paludibacteraceae bacterium]MBQ3913771.1 biopolymer transporter ExbD [Paludibacteraceae bacterium]MBQ7672156.1 biopolymer transporter ExbD [Paludibacteraceae bacterium]MBR4459914.1 biopolymer transporter ExbD [Paludibacteraceae bacterium]
MALKRRTKVEASFIMSSMTDLIFLLLIFFVLASTMSAPNDIKINLPSSKAQTNTRQVVAKVFIDNLGNYSVAVGKTKPVPVEPEMLDAYLCQVQAQDSTMYIALHADQDIAYKEVVRVLDIANQHHMKLVVATKK